MLPPIDPDVRASNPKFDAMYNNLCNHKLNPDGTTKLDAKAQRERDTLSEDLRKARVEAAKREIVKSGLQELSYRSEALPEELQELVTVVATILEGQIPEDDRDLLQDDITKFKDKVKPIATALSQWLEQDMKTLSTILDHETSSGPKDIASNVEDLKASIADSRTKTAEARLTLTQEATKLHAVYREIIQASVRILEQTIHGSVARGAKAKADYLATVAEGMSKKLGVQHGQLMSQLYSPDVQIVLQSKRDELVVETTAAKWKAREAEQKLEEYRNSGGMEEVAKEYAEILRESDKVKAELGRLKDGDR